MDTVISQLADYTSELTFEQLPDDVVQAATQRLIDSIGCAIGAWDCEAAEIGRRLAPTVSDGLRARPLGAGERSTTVEAAGFINSAMIRYLDFNDTFPGGHPSDALGPVIALADALGSSGARLITALVAGYDIFIAQAKAAKLRERGWDQGFGIGLATAAGASILLGLDEKRTWHALSISAVSNVPMRATRAGELSLWKGAATSYAARNALFGTLLAAEGMTGPEAPIDGRHGLKELVTGEFDLPPFTPGESGFMTRQARIKYWPVEYHLQAAVWAGIELGKVVRPEELESVEIATYWSAWHETGSEPAKWDPRTRETADHSMPYVFTTALTTGALELSAFEPESYLNPAQRELMAKVSVKVDDELEKIFPERIVMRARARTTDGRVHDVEIVNPLGHEGNPVNDDQLSRKFRRLVEPVYGSARATQALSAWQKIAAAETVTPALDSLVLGDRRG